LPPVSILFAAFLGYNPIQHLLGAPALASLSAHNQAVLAGRAFFPHLIAAPFRVGLHEAFAFAIAACLIAAAASLLRGKHPQTPARLPPTADTASAGERSPDGVAARVRRARTLARIAARK
jgi:hypothetical protein